MRRFLFWISMALFLALLVPITALVQAQDGPSAVAVVRAWTLNVRAGPGIEYPVIGAVYAGDRLPVLDQSDGWVKVAWQGEEGWVSSWYVLIQNQNVTPPTMTSVPTAMPTMTSVPTATPTMTSVPTASPTMTSPPAAMPTMTSVPTASPTMTSRPAAMPTMTSVPTAIPTMTSRPAAMPSITPYPIATRPPGSMITPSPLATLILQTRTPIPTITSVLPTRTAVTDAPSTDAPSATTQGASTGGKIAFATFPEGLIYTVNADGSNLQPLTTGVDPAWSPTGDRLAFVDEREQVALYVINADGTGREQIYDQASVKQPAWSPDSNQIAFSVQKGGHLKDYEICYYAPTGELIFCRDFDADPHWRLYRIQLDPRELDDIPSLHHSISPNWLSNSEILFTGDTRLHVVNPDSGEDPREIFDEARFVDPRLCPLTGQVAMTYHQHDHWEVHTIHSSAMGWKRLTGTDSVLVDSTPNNVVGAWSPDCSQFIFFSDRDGRWRPYIMNSDGSNERPFLPEVFDQFTFDFTYGYNNNSLIDWTQ